MKLIKPAFIHHDNKPIFSCDIHPDGLRFATGGQGQYSGRIAIWNLRAVVDESVAQDENVPKLLCHLDNHLSCVNCVRWSNSGKSLASGGDDKLVMIWTLSGDARLNADGVLIGLEQWRCAHTLSGHDSDVLDVAWAPFDTKLATCSVDNSVIVWSMDCKPVVLARLTGHAGLVKGVAWDPVGEFLASQSDDRTLRLWRTSNWTQQAVITEPFKDCGDMTHVLRLHWSPDGQYVVSAHASNCGGPTAQIIERPMDAEKLAWMCDMDFVGHRKAVTCVKFNGNLLKKPNAERKFCVAATGSRDCSIAVWSTQQRRPLIVVNNIFSKSVLDMSWASDGRIFMACSWDGTVAFFHFKEAELGTVVSSEEKLTALEGLYGKRLLHGKIEPIVEVPELMAVVPAPQESTPVAPKKDPAPPEPRLFQAKQIEVRGADGKRRITPITVPRDAPVPNLESFSSSCSTKTKIIVEKRGIETVESAPPEPSVEPTPAKQKRISLLRSEVTPAVRPVVATERPRVDSRPTTTPILKPLGMEAGGTITINGVPTHCIVVENSKDVPVTRIRRESKPVDGEIIWEVVLGHTVTAARSTKTLTILVCVDRTVNVLDTSSGGPRGLPFLLPGPAACIDLNLRDQLCVVTTCGFVLTWDLQINALTLSDHTLRGELQADSSAFALCRLKDDGYPIVVMTNGRSFSYSKSLGWQLLTDIKTAVWQLSSQKDFLTALPAPDAHLPLRSLMRELRASCSGGLARESGGARSTTAAHCSVMLLFMQFHAAVALGSQEEVRGLLIALVRLLAQDCGLIQLKEVLTIHAKQRGLMDECLAILKEYLPCQRLYMELSAGLLINGGDESLGPPNNE